MKKDIRPWAIKLKNRSFHQNADGIPFMYKTLTSASEVAKRITHFQAIKAEPVRVRVRIEEIE
jgi:hypothetical protein